MMFGKKFTALCLAGFLMSLAAPVSRAQQTAEVSAQTTAAVEFVKDCGSYINGKIGTVPFDRWSEEDLATATNISCGCKIEKFMYNNSMAECLAMLKSGRADFILTSDIAAIYMTQRNADLKAIVDPGELGAVMLFRGSDAALKGKFDEAIKKLKENGKSADLEKKWIRELPVGQEPAMGRIEKVSDTAETVYVGVSGDMPPLDYVAADGKPSGYNVALLAEISKLIGKNIEIVSLDSQARFVALESKKIDVFFWIVLPYDKTAVEALKNAPTEQEFFKKYSTSEPYCVFKTGFVFKK